MHIETLVNLLFRRKIFFLAISLLFQKSKRTNCSVIPVASSRITPMNYLGEKPTFFSNCIFLLFLRATSAYLPCNSQLFSPNERMWNRYPTLFTRTPKERKNKIRRGCSSRCAWKNYRRPKDNQLLCRNRKLPILIQQGPVSGSPCQFFLSLCYQWMEKQSNA